MTGAKPKALCATTAGLRAFAVGGATTAPSKPQQMLTRAMRRARALKRQSQGFAAMCAVVRISTSEGLDRVLAAMVDETPRASSAGCYLVQARRWVRGTPRDALTGWVRRVGTGPSGGR